jgi:hypothetical protein
VSLRVYCQSEHLLASDSVSVWPATFTFCAFLTLHPRLEFIHVQRRLCLSGLCCYSATAPSPLLRFDYHHPPSHSLLRIRSQLDLDETRPCALPCLTRRLRNHRRPRRGETHSHVPNNKPHIATYSVHLFFTYLPLRLGPRNKDGNITGLHGERERLIRERTDNGQTGCGQVEGQASATGTGGGPIAHIPLARTLGASTLAITWRK